MYGSIQLINKPYGCEILKFKSHLTSSPAFLRGCAAAFWLCVWKDAAGQSAALAAHACSWGSARRQPSLCSYLPPIRPPAGQAQPCCNWLSPTEPSGGFRLQSCTEKPITHCCTPTHCRPIERERREGVCAWIHPEESTACVLVQIQTGRNDRNLINQLRSVWGWWICVCVWRCVCVLSDKPICRGLKLTQVCVIYLE